MVWVVLEAACRCSRWSCLEAEKKVEGANEKNKSHPDAGS